MAELAVRLLQLIIHNLDREDAGVAGEDDLVLVEHGGPDGVEGEAPQLHGSLVAEEGVGEAAGFSGVLMERPGLLDLLVGLWRSLWAAGSLDALVVRLGLLTFLWVLVKLAIA